MRKLQFLLNKTFKLGRYTFSFLINKNKYLPKLKYFDFIKIIFTFGMKVFFFVQVAAIIIYYLITLNFSEFFSYLISNISSMYESIGNMFSNLFNFNKNIENSVDTVKDEVKNPSKTDLSNVKRVNIDELNEKEKQKFISDYLNRRHKSFNTDNIPSDYNFENDKLPTTSSDKTDYVFYIVIGTVVVAVGFATYLYFNPDLNAKLTDWLFSWWQPKDPKGKGPETRPSDTEGFFKPFGGDPTASSTASSSATASSSSSVEYPKADDSFGITTEQSYIFGSVNSFLDIKDKVILEVIKRGTTDEIDRITRVNTFEDLYNFKEYWSKKQVSSIETSALDLSKFNNESIFSSHSIDSSSSSGSSSSTVTPTTNTWSSVVSNAVNHLFHNDSYYLAKKFAKLGLSASMIKQKKFDHESLIRIALEHLNEEDIDDINMFDINNKLGIFSNKK